MGVGRSEGMSGVGIEVFAVFGVGLRLMTWKGDVSVVAAADAAIELNISKWPRYRYGQLTIDDREDSQYRHHYPRQNGPTPYLRLALPSRWWSPVLIPVLLHPSNPTSSPKLTKALTTY